MAMVMGLASRFGLGLLFGIAAMVAMMGLVPMVIVLLDECGLVDGESGQWLVRPASIGGGAAVLLWFLFGSRDGSPARGDRRVARGR